MKIYTEGYFSSKKPVKLNLLLFCFMLYSCSVAYRGVGVIMGVLPAPELAAKKGKRVKPSPGNGHSIFLK